MERYYGIYLGFCVDNLDPDNRNRITLRIPQLFGEIAVTTWALPCSPVTSTAVPTINQPVWVMFVAGDANFPVWMGVLND